MSFGYQMPKAVTDHIVAPSFCGCVALISAEQDLRVVLMRGDETRSYHTAEQCPWDMANFRMDQQPAAEVQLKRERGPLEDTATTKNENISLIHIWFDAIRC